MSDLLFVLIDDLSENNYDSEKIKSDYKINDKVLLKILYKVLHLSVEDHFGYKMYSTDLVYNTLKAIEELSSNIKLNSDEITKIERKKLEQIDFLKKLRIKEGKERNKEVKKIITKLENTIIYPSNAKNTKYNNADFEYLINNEADIYIIKSYLFETQNRIKEIKNDENILNILEENFIKYYNLKDEKMYYYLYILMILKPNKIHNSKIKKLYKNIHKNIEYDKALKVFNMILNGKDLNLNEEDILELYNIKNTYSENLRTISFNTNIKNVETNSITIDSQKTSNVKDDSLSISKTKNEYIFGIHISNVGEFISEEDAEILRKRFISLYLPNIVIDMIKEKNIKNSLSMDEGKKRNALSLTTIFSKSGTLKDFYFNTSTTKVIANYNYDDVDKILLRGKSDRNSSMLFDLFEITSILKSAQNSKINYREVKENEKDSVLNNFYEYNTISHGIVEEAMILYNSLIAEYMYTNGYPFIYRNHEANTIDYNIPSSLRKYYNNTYGNSYYSTENLGHAGLNINYYSHSSSPMRRYPDAVNQQLYLNPNCYSIKELEKIAKYSNEKEKTLKLVKDSYISSLNATRKL